MTQHVQALLSLIWHAIWTSIIATNQVNTPDNNISKPYTSDHKWSCKPCEFYFTKQVLILYACNKTDKYVFFHYLFSLKRDFHYFDKHLLKQQ